MTMFSVRRLPFRKVFVKGMMISSSSVAIWVNDPSPGVSSPSSSFSMNADLAFCWSEPT